MHYIMGVIVAMMLLAGCDGGDVTPPPTGTLVTTTTPDSDVPTIPPETLNPSSIQTAEPSWHTLNPPSDFVNPPDSTGLGKG